MRRLEVRRWSVQIRICVGDDSRHCRRIFSENADCVEFDAAGGAALVGRCGFRRSEVNVPNIGHIQSPFRRFRRCRDSPFHFEEIIDRHIS